MHPLVGLGGGWGLSVVNSLLPNIWLLLLTNKGYEIDIGIGQWIVHEQRQLAKISGDDLHKWKVTSEKAISFRYSGVFRWLQEPSKASRDWGIALFWSSAVERHKQQFFWKRWSLWTVLLELLSVRLWTHLAESSDVEIWGICLNWRSGMNWRIRVSEFIEWRWGRMEWSSPHYFSFLDGVED